MSSVVTRRTVVRESTVTKRRNSSQYDGHADPYSSEGKENSRHSHGAYLRNSTSQMNLPAYMEEDYFESGSYRPDRIGKPWRSPNLSRRGIRSSYRESESMTKRHSQTSLYYNVSEASNGSNSNTQTHAVSSATPANSKYMRTPCQRSGGTGGMCTHADCVASQKIEQQHSTQVIHEYLNTNHNNSMSHAAKQMSSNSVRSSAVGRVSVWRASSDNQNATTSVDKVSVVQENTNASTRGGSRGDKKKVSSIFGLDETNEGRVTRSRSRRLDAGNVNATTNFNTTNSSSSEVKPSESRPSSWRFAHLLCVAHYIQMTYTRVKTYSGAPYGLLVPFYLLAIFVRYLVCLPITLFRSICTLLGFSSKSEEQVERDARKKRRGAAGWCWQCIYIILPILLLLLLILFFTNCGDPREDEVSAISALQLYAGQVMETAKEGLLTIWNYLWGFMCSIACWVSYTASSVFCCIRHGFSSLNPVLILDMMRNGVCTTKEYILWVIHGERDAELGDRTLREKDTRDTSYDPPVVRVANDAQLADLISAIKDHDRRLRLQEKDLQWQRKQLDQLMVSVSTSEKNTNDLKSTMANWESDLKEVKTRTLRIDHILKQLSELRMQISKTDSQLILQEANKHKDATAKDLQAVRALVETLRTVVEKDRLSVKSDLTRHEEALKLLTSKVNEVDMLKLQASKKPATPDPEFERLVAKVTSGHTRMADLEAHHQKLVELLTLLKNEQSKIVLQQKATEKQLLAVSKAADFKGTVGVGRSLGGCLGDRLSRNDVQRMIDNTIDIFAADRLARPDFALESAGGSIIGTRCTQTYTDRPAVFSLFGVPLFRLSRSPRSVIQPAVQPGECWAFRGSKGQVVVRLSNDVAITAITLEHIPASLSPNGQIKSAPREFEVRGLESESDYEGWLLGSFEYSANGPPLQTFEIGQKINTESTNESKLKKTRPATFRYVEVKVLSNQGHTEYTCVYRLRVHGNFIDQAGNGST